MAIKYKQDKNNEFKSVDRDIGNMILKTMILI